MNVIGTVLTFLVGIEHIGICFLEIFGKPEMQAKASSSTPKSRYSKKRL